MTKQSSCPDGVGRYFVPDVQELWQRLGPAPEAERRVVEHVYFDRAQPGLFYTAFARGRRWVPEASTPLGSGGPWQSEYRSSGESAVIRVEPEAFGLSELGDQLREASSMEDLAPWFGVRFRRDRYRVGRLVVDLDSDVTYYSLIGKEPFFIGRESLPRMTARVAGGGPKHLQRLNELLEDLPKSPDTSKKWMGFHFMKSCYELPRHDDLAGFEYELKMDAESLDIHPGSIPFPVLEVHQSDSLRRYYDEYRACLRGDSAHTVTKGPVVSLGGVLRRAEAKDRALEPWALPEPQMVMRRYKREVNVLNPDSHRVYTLSLHYCDAGETFQQLEIEYDGRLVPGAVTSMARFRLSHDPHHFLEMATRADARGWGAVGDELRTRYLRLAPDAPDREEVEASMSRVGEQRSDAIDTAAEEEVVSDMRLLRSSLLRLPSLTPSRRTKRRWLRAVYGARGA